MELLALLAILSPLIVLTLWTAFKPVHRTSDNTNQTSD